MCPSDEGIPKGEPISSIKTREEPFLNCDPIEIKEPFVK